MARIRSVKPEFWTSEQIAECSPTARLAFIGMWNFCDDYGVHPASCARLKMEVFPADAISSADVRRMIDELLANGLLQEYKIAGTLYWLVTGFDKHQKPDTKTGKYPLPDGSIGGKIRRKSADNSPNIPQQDAERSPLEVEVDLEVDKEKSLVSEKPKLKKAHALPDDFVPNGACKELAEKLGVDVDSELPKFRDFHLMKGTLGKDWDAGFRTWLNNAVKFGTASKVVASTTNPLFAGAL